MKYDLIIFDYDGVVADSEVLNSTVMAEQLTAIGLPTTLDEVLAAYTGRRWRDNRPMVGPRWAVPVPTTSTPPGSAPAGAARRRT